MERLNPGYYSGAQLREIGFKSAGENVRVAKNCTIVGPGNISLGDNVRIDGFTTIIAPGEGYLTLGSYVHIGSHCTLLASAGIVMRDFSCLSHGVRLYTKSDDYSGEFMTNPMVPSHLTNVTSAPIVIGRHAIVGSQASIMPGCFLADGSAIGANSLVTKDCEEWTIYAGSPARKIKERKRNPLTLEKFITAPAR
ncbi:acyltransferase [Erwinia aphidicola]|uniref:acyltransferase n=1 Tax=Erwinia aphidicola TaxID=68334 RepID=UPI0020A1DF49|nr:acyltransferase [Erwinia aphidicola]MCP2230213.1 galactoside O-acetyltransferase [Erwinia aphidicola]